MRILILISSDFYVRNFVSSGAFSELDGDGHETYYLSGPLRHPALLEQQRHYLGAIQIEPRRRRLYTELSYVLMFGYRHRSSTFRIKADTRFRLRDRVKYTALAAPGLRALTWSALMRLTGENQPLKQVLLDLRPDLVIAPSAVTDPLLIDMARLGKRLQIPTLFLISGWDNLSSKLVFPETPDYLAVWSEESVRHAKTIHEIAPGRVFVVGAPIYDAYVQATREQAPAPYPFRYVLFAGCAIPFDEISALRALEAVMESRGITDFKIVYRPHPWRQRRSCFDVFEPEQYRHVIMDEQVREAYVRTVATQDYEAAKGFMPSLEYYPPLLCHAEFVICPLSTMIMESALCETPVLVIAYDDPAHPLSPDKALGQEHFKGIETIEGFRLCRDFGHLAEDFLAVVERCRRLERDQGRRVSLREQMRRYLHFDERTYAQRLRDLVTHLAQHERVGAGRP
ncbi:MAG: hypothetical protein HYZ91_01115 [Candidatus Omnitrophica bacterium]|nr:hypothetical protein [Candidatus Omnitrophota bacterium]